MNAWESICLPTEIRTFAVLLAINFFAVDFGWPKDVHTLSMCRQIDNCADENGEYLVGTRGMCHVNRYEINGQRILTRAQLDEHPDPYVQEHTDLIECVRSGKPINELKNVAESTLTAIMGRMSAYTGKAVEWDVALNSKLDTFPQNLAMGNPMPQLAVLPLQSILLNQSPES